MRKTSLRMMLLSLLFILLSCSSKDNTTNPPGPTGDRDLRVNLNGMDEHVSQYMEFKLISSDNNLQGLTIIDPLIQPNEKFWMPKAVSGTSNRLDFFADLNYNRAYDPPPADHAWRVGVPDTGTAAVVNYTHDNSNMVDISSPPFNDMGNAFVLNLTNFAEHMGQMLEVHVIDQTSGRTVGVYRLNVMIQSDFSITIPRIIKDGTPYQVDFFADQNTNRHYDPPPTDHAWRLTGTGTSGGLTINFGHDTNFTDIGFQGP